MEEVFQAKQPMKGQNILGITLKIGDRIIPLNMRLISKQGRGNTDKPSCVITMFKEVVSFFEGTGIISETIRSPSIRGMVAAT